MNLLCKKFTNIKHCKDYCDFLNALNEDEFGNQIQNIEIDYIYNFMKNTRNNILFIKNSEPAELNYKEKSIKLLFAKTNTVKDIIDKKTLDAFNKIYGKTFTMKYLEILQEKSGDVFAYNIF
ncbi:MAG: hypothetical protein ACYDDE_00620 [bacterium]